MPALATAQRSFFSPLGDARSAERTATGILVHGTGGSVLIESVREVGVRIRTRFGNAPLSAFVPPRSLATGDSAPQLSAIAMRELGDTIALSGALHLTVFVAMHPLRISVRDSAGRELLRDSYGAAALGQSVAYYSHSDSTTRYFALGEQPTPLARNGTVFPFWNTDRFAYGPGDTPIYSTMPFYIAVDHGAAYGVLYDNPFRGEMDFAGRLSGSIAYSADGAPDGGELRYYVIPGPTLDQVLERFSRLTGRLPLPPRWALGYHQSRYSYAPDSMLMNVAREMRRRDIPADALYLDIDYMSGFRVFTWSPTGFAHPKQTLDSLASMGFKVIAIIDPGVKVDSAYSVYQDGLARHAFLTTPDGAPALGKVWPGIAAFPDFSRAEVREWWGNAQRAVVDSGVSGIWNDMNEPSSFTGFTLSDLVRFDDDGHPGGHVEYHNQYGTLMARASFEGLREIQPSQRPFVITRAAYTGVQRYSSVWTGDNRSTWEHLRLEIPMVLSLGLSGEPFAGSDIGGFAGTPTPELYARWLQSAALLPFFRTHSAIDVPRREPWSYGGEYERANRATIRLRYQLLPAIYTAFYQHTRTGRPVVRPLLWDELADTAALGTNDEYFVGDHLLAAPVVDSGAGQRAVYLPRGRWYRLGDDSAYDGARRVTVRAPEALSDGGDTTGLRGLPVFARAGAVIPMQSVMLYDGQRALDTLVLHVWPGGENPVSSAIYEDAGNGYEYQRGGYRLTTITTAELSRSRTFEITLRREGSYTGAGVYVAVVHALARPQSVRVDGKAARFSYNDVQHTATFSMRATARRVSIAR